MGITPTRAGRLCVAITEQTVEGARKAMLAAARVADFIELGELMCIDALQRNESCGGHFREESQTPDGEADRKDNEFSYVSAWQFKSDSEWELHKEELKFEVAKPTQRSYK